MRSQDAGDDATEVDAIRRLNQVAGGVIAGALIGVPILLVVGFVVWMIIGLATCNCLIDGVRA